MAEFPNTQQAAVVVRDDGSFHFSIESVPVPKPKPNEILVRLTASGICGTDIGLASGKLGPSCGILGHEGVGRVVHLPKVDSVVESTGLRIGDRVGIAWVRDICGECPYCLSPGGETRCREQMNSGRKFDGTFAEYAVIPTRYVIRIPEGIEDEFVAPILCGGVTAYKALKISGATSGQWIAISGAGGGVGALAIQYARAMGYRVISIDIGKEAFCLGLGSDAYIDAAADRDVAEIVDGLTNGGMVHAVIAAAGIAQAYQLGLDLLAPFGTLVCVGIPPPDQRVSFHPLTFIDKGIRIIGSAVGTRADITEALSFIQRGVFKPVVKLIGMKDIPVVAKSIAQATEKYVVTIG